MRQAVIPEFPLYSITDEGQVINNDTGRVLALSVNRNGVVQVGLMKYGRQYKRGVALLVATAFLDPPTPETFDTPIHLDGDKLNNRLDNLMWRPRWFAIMYQRQHELFTRPSLNEPIIDLATREKFRDSWDAATKFGLLDEEIAEAIRARTYVWPTYQRFQEVG